MLNQGPSFIRWNWTFLINELRHPLSWPNFLRIDIKNHGKVLGFLFRDKKVAVSPPPSASGSRDYRK